MKRVSLADASASLALLAGVLALWWAASHGGWVSAQYCKPPETINTIAAQAIHALAPSQKHRQSAVLAACAGAMRPPAQAR